MGNKIKVYIITIATALSSFAAGAFSDFDAKAAVSRPAAKTFSVQVQASDLLGLATLVETKACPLVDAEYDLTGGDVCTSTNYTQSVCVSFNSLDGGGKEYWLALQTELPGSWTIGAPQ